MVVISLSNKVGAFKPPYQLCFGIVFRMRVGSVARMPSRLGISLASRLRTDRRVPTLSAFLVVDAYNALCAFTWETLRAFHCGSDGHPILYGGDAVVSPYNLSVSSHLSPCLSTAHPRLTLILYVVACLFCRVASVARRLPSSSVTSSSPAE